MQTSLHRQQQFAASSSAAASSFAWDDQQQQLLDELLEIFMPQEQEEREQVSTGGYGQNEYSYEEADTQAVSPTRFKTYFDNTQSSPFQPAAVNNNNNPGVSPMKRPSGYHGQMPVAGFSLPDSPSASSSDESGAYMGAKSGFKFGEIDMNATAGSPMGNGGDYDLGDLELNASGSPMSAKEKRQLEMRRKRNRESMRRVRQRKRIEYSELKKLLPGLEARLNHLREMKLEQERQLAGGAATAMVESRSGVAGAPGPGLSKAMEQLRIVEDAFRRENAWLEQEIDKYEQAFVALQDLTEELRESDALTEAPIDNDPFAWTSRVTSFLPHFHRAELFDVVRHSVIEVVRQVEAAHRLQETAEEILGWRTRRTVNGPWIQFAVSKDFANEDIEAIAQKTWLVNSQSHTIHATMPQNHNMKVLRVVNENTIICARNLFFPGDETNYCTIYLFMRVKTAKGYVLAQRSLLPEDGEVLKLHLGSKYSYVNIFYGIILERHTMVDAEGNTVFAPAGCKCTFGGLAGNGTEIYVNTWAKDLFIAMLRWENSCVGPLYRLVSS